jgi:hypothetical protein
MLPGWFSTADSTYVRLSGKKKANGYVCTNQTRSATAPARTTSSGE